VVNIWNIC